MTTAPESVHVAFREAFNRHDLDAIVALYEADAVFVAAHKPAQGRDAIREAYQDIFRSSPVMDLQTVSVICSGGLALLQGKWTAHRIGDDGGSTTNEGVSVELVRLQSDGRWLFVIDNPSIV